jgi:hypothetical protein
MKPNRKLVIVVIILTAVTSVYISHLYTWDIHNVSYSEEIEGEVCEVRSSQGHDKFRICDKLKEYYFSVDQGKTREVESKVRSFVKAEETRILKEANSAIVYFINDDNTLIVRYEVSTNDTKALINGEIVKGRAGGVGN